MAQMTDNLKALEQTHVYDVYNEMAPHVCEIWHKAWPKVKHFLKDVEPGALVADIGCGSGRYLKINKSIFKMGSDICVPLVNNARHRGYEVMVCDNLNLPYRDGVFDAVISIGVIHHFTTTERRLQAMKELARILRPGGKLMLYVWAYEQKHRKFDSQEVLIPWNFQTKHGIKSGSKLIKNSSIEKDFSSTSSISEDDMSGDGQENPYNPESLDNDICNNKRHRNTHDSLTFVEELQQLGAKLKALTQTTSLHLQSNGSCETLKSLNLSSDVNCISSESNIDLMQSIENERPLTLTTVQNGRIRKQLHKQKCLHDQVNLTKSLSDFMATKTGSLPAISYTKSISYSYSDLCDSESNPDPQDMNNRSDDFQFPTLQEFKNGVCEFFGLKKKSTNSSDKNPKKLLDNGVPFNSKFNILLESSLRYHSLPEGDFFAVREFPQSSHPAFRKHLSFTVGDSAAITDTLALADDLPTLSSILTTEVKSSDYEPVMESTTKTQSDNRIDNMQSKSEKTGNNHHMHNSARHLEYTSNNQSAKCIIGLHHKKDSNETCDREAGTYNYTNPTMPVYNHEKNSVENNGLYQVSKTQNAASSGFDKKCICSLNDQCANDMSSGDSRYRYYHVFRQGELQQLIGKNISSLEITQTTYDHANWCVIAEKKQRNSHDSLDNIF